MSIIIVTGAEHSLGQQTCKYLAIQGNVVYAGIPNVRTRNLTGAEELSSWAKAQGADIRVSELDSTSEGSVRCFINQIVAETNNQIDVLVNNDEMAVIGLNQTLRSEEVEKTFQINVISVDRMIKAVLPFMHAQKKGLILTISGLAARHCAPMMGFFAASKAAIDALCTSYYYELRQSKIDVSIIQSGSYPKAEILPTNSFLSNEQLRTWYGPNIIAYQENVLKYLQALSHDKNTAEVCDVISSLVQAENGERPLWTLVGTGHMAMALGSINNSIRRFTELTLQASQDVQNRI